MGEVTIDLDTEEDWGDWDDKAKENQVKQKFKDWINRIKMENTEEEKGWLEKGWDWIKNHKKEIIVAAAIIVGVAAIGMGGFIVITTATGIADCSLIAGFGLTGAEIALDIGLGLMWIGYELSIAGLQMVDINLPSCPFPNPHLPPIP